MAFIRMARCYPACELTGPGRVGKGSAAGSGTVSLMPTQQLLDRVRELRDADRTPKEIARSLKMPPSAVAPLIRSVAAAEGRTREDVLIGFWTSPGWSASVQAPERPDWPGSGLDRLPRHARLPQPARQV
jgi:hypothetical protein